MINEILDTTVLNNNDSAGHHLTLMAIAISLKAKKILELGVRAGGTTKPLIAAAKINKGLVQSVDIKDCSNVVGENLLAWWNFKQQDAIEFLTKKVAEKECYDLIYLDDFHSYDHVKKELYLIDRLVSPKSVVLIHDLMYNTEPYYHTDLTLTKGQWANGGPYRAVAELDPQFWEFATIPASNGLTILRKKYTGLFHK